MLSTLRSKAHFLESFQPFCQLGETRFFLLRSCPILVFLDSSKCFPELGQNKILELAGPKIFLVICMKNCPQFNFGVVTCYFQRYFSSSMIMKNSRKRRSTFADAVPIPTGLPRWSQKAAALIHQRERERAKQVPPTTASVRLQRQQQLYLELHNKIHKISKSLECHKQNLHSSHATQNLTASPQ